MDAKEVRKLTDEEIAVELDRTQRKLYDLRAAAVTDKIEDPSQFTKLRREIARMRTEQHARVLRAEEATA